MKSSTAHRRRFSKQKLREIKEIIIEIQENISLYLVLPRYNRQQLRHPVHDKRILREDRPPPMAPQYQRSGHGPADAAHQQQGDSTGEGRSRRVAGAVVERNKYKKGGGSGI